MYGRILVPVDGSETSTCGLTEAIKIAKSQGSKLRLVHIVNEFILDGSYSPGMYANDFFQALRDTGTAVLKHAEMLAREQGVESEGVMIESIAAQASDLIIAQAKKWPADLIVMGTHGRRGLARLAMGSDAEEVVRTAPVPVLLVRSTAPSAKASRAREAVEVSVA